MRNVLDLTQMKHAEQGTIIAIAGGHGLRRRMETLGIRKGAEIIKISAQIMRGPIIVQVVNTQVAIGFGIAKKIIVETGNEGSVKASE